MPYQTSPLSRCASTVTTPTIVEMKAGTTISISTAFVEVEWVVKVVWESSDLSVFTPKSAPLLPLSSQAVSGNDSSVPNPTRKKQHPSGTAGDHSSTSGNSSAAGHSSGAKAGIGVGVPIAALALLVAIVLCIRYRRRKSPRNEPSNGRQPESQTEYPTADAEESASEMPGGSQIHEAHGTSKPAEADPSTMRAELDSGWPGHETQRSRM